MLLFLPVSPYFKKIRKIQNRYNSFFLAQKCARESLRHKDKDKNTQIQIHRAAGESLRIGIRMRG